MAEIQANSQVREQDYPLTDGKMAPDVERAIVNKEIVRFREMWEYWSTRLDAGDDNWRALIGKTLTPAERAFYVKQNKIILEIPELVPKINALEGMQISSRRRGRVIAAGGEDAPDVDIIQHILRDDVQRKNNLEMELTRCFTDALVSSYPQALWFDAASPFDRDKKLDAHHGLWNDTLLDPKFSRMDYSDAQDVVRIRTMSRDQLLTNYPGREARISELIPEGGAYDSLALASFSNQDSSENRDQVVRRLNSMLTQYAQNGLIYVIERMFFVRVPTEVWVRPGSEAIEVIPPEWTPEEKEAWKQANPEYKAIKRDMPILWVTTVSPFGIVLENKPHWFQEGEFPMEVYIPRMWNNKIYGVVEFLKPSLRGRNITKMESLHSLRMANDGLMLVKEGALHNPSVAAVEKGRAGGILVLKRFAQMSDVGFPENRREQQGWDVMSESFLGDIDRLSVDRNFEGGTQASQESGRAIGIRINQTQNKHLAYLTSYTLFDLRVNRKIVMMIPYRWTEWEIFRYVDPKMPQQQQEVELNAPEEYDLMTGAVTRIKNNLDGAKYDYIEAEGDNSASAKEMELLVFNDILKNVTQMQDPRYWPELLEAYPNSLAQEFGRNMRRRFAEEDAAAAEAKPQAAPAKVSVSISGDEIKDPMVLELLRGVGVLPEAPEPEGPGGPGGGVMNEELAGLMAQA